MHPMIVLCKQLPPLKRMQPEGKISKNQNSLLREEGEREGEKERKCYFMKLNLKKSKRCKFPPAGE